MSLTDPIFSVLIILIAYFCPVCICLAKNTFPKPPSPSFLPISYYPKQLLESNSSPLVAYSTVLCLMYLRSSQKYSAPSELNSLITFCPNVFLTSLKESRLWVTLISQGLRLVELVSQIKICMDRQLLFFSRLWFLLRRGERTLL